MLISEEILHQTMAIIPVNFNAFALGLAFGWVSPTLETLSHPESVLPLTTAESSAVGSLQEVGRIAGSILGVFLVDTIGRRKSLTISGTIFFVQWILVWMTQSVWVICLVRFVFGLGVGVQEVCSAIYMSENSSPNIRGVYFSTNLSFFYLGILAEYLFTNYFSYYDVALINAIVGGVCSLALVLLREPAQYLIMKGKLDEAKKNFLWLRGTNANNQQVLLEFTSMSRNICEERDRRESLVELLSTPYIYKIVSILFVFYVLNQATGYSAIHSYATVSFSSGFFTKKELTVVLGALQLVAVSLSSLIIERFPRKTIMRTLFAAAGLVHLCSASLFFTQQYVCEIPNFSWYIFSSISSYPVIYAVGILPCFALVRGEMFPMSIKAVGGCICVVGHSLMGICVNFVYLRVAEQYGMYVNFLFFSICCFVSVLYVHFMLLETRGKSLVEIQRCIEKKSVEC